MGMERKTRAKLQSRSAGNALQRGPMRGLNAEVGRQSYEFFAYITKCDGRRGKPHLGCQLCSEQVIHKDSRALRIALEFDDVIAIGGRPPPPKRPPTPPQASSVVIEPEQGPRVLFV